jgi:hypothetical protein
LHVALVGEEAPKVEKEEEELRREAKQVVGQGGGFKWGRCQVEYTVQVCPVF